MLVSGCIPLNVSNGSMQPVKPLFAFGETAVYLCDEGYNMTSGDSNTTCQTDGTWDGTLPTCSSKFIHVHVLVTYWQTMYILRCCWCVVVVLFLIFVCFS